MWWKPKIDVNILSKPALCDRSSFTANFVRSTTPKHLKRKDINILKETLRLLKH